MLLTMIGVLTFLGALQPECVQASKILMLPWSVHSHVVQMAAIGDSLTEKGHDVHMVLAESYPFAFRHKLGKIKFHTYKMGEKDIYTQERPEGEDKVKERENREKLFMERARLDLVDDLRMNYDGVVELCRNALADEELQAKLKEFEFDVAVVDTSPMSRCLTVIPYELDVPFIALSTVYEPWLSRTPALPSFVPMAIQTTYTDDMSFWQRLWNIWYMYDWYTCPKTSTLDQDFVSEFAPKKPWISLTDLVRKSMLWLVTTDVAIDYPRPRMSNEIFVGGLTTKPAKPLAPAMEKVVNASKDGTIIVSLGDMGEFLPIQIRDKLVAAFVTFKMYRIIWHLKAPYPKNIPSHITFTDWMPLNDLLGHPSTKLFITHAGANVQFEALYNAVPTLMFPVTGDQFYNARRAEEAGLGIQMDITNFQAGEVVANMLKLVGEESLTESVQKASAAFRHAVQSPRARAVHWIEYCLKFGGEKLRSPAVEMGWMEYTMMDLIIYFSIFLAIGLCLCWNTCVLLGRIALDKLQKMRQLKQQQNGVGVARTTIHTTATTSSNVTYQPVRTSYSVFTKPPVTQNLSSINKPKLL
jgi:glucuronosyltransferase